MYCINKKKRKKKTNLGMVTNVNLSSIGIIMFKSPLGVIVSRNPLGNVLHGGQMTFQPHISNNDVSSHGSKVTM